MPKKPTKISLLDALGSIREFIVGAKERPDLPAAAIREKVNAVDLSALRAAVDALEERRADVLVYGTDAETAALDAEIAEAERAYDRGNAYLRRLEEMLAGAEDREAAELLEQKRAEAKRLTSEAIAAIRSKLPEAYRAIHDVLRLVGQAEAAVANVNEYSPPEAQLTGPESWRNELAQAPERILSTKQIQLWVDAATGEPLSKETAAQVHDLGNGRGTVVVSFAPGMASRYTEVERRSFTRIERQPARYGESVRPLAATLNLPPLRAREHEFWDASEARFAEGADLLKLLEDKAATAGKPWPEPPSLITHEPSSTGGVGAAVKNAIAKLTDAA